MKRRYFVLFVALPVALVLALVAFYRIEDRRGMRAWEAVERDARARGEPLDLTVLMPSPGPDERNLAKAPVILRALVEGYTWSVATQPVGWFDMPYGRGGDQPQIGKDDWKTGRPLPLMDWQRHFAKSKQCPHPAQPGEPATDVMLALTAFAPLLDELVHETETRTQALAPIDWREEPAINVRFPAGPLFVKMAVVLRLRASAELAGGLHDNALRDTLAALRLCEALGRQPLLLGALDANAGTAAVLQPVWEGLATRRWTADELGRIEQALRRDDSLENYVRAVRGDRAIICQTLESIHKSCVNGEALLSGGSGRPLTSFDEEMAKAFTVVPRGWIDQNKASACQLYQRHVDTVDLRSQTVSLQKVKATADEVSALKKKPYLVYTLFVRSAAPMEDYLLLRTARVQAACEQAIIACALERRYLDHHDYPDSLGTLVPDYLDRVPNDVIDGAPMRYRRTEDGRYVLYGIGWNGRDDGGVIAWSHGTSAGSPARPDDSGGDWVWQYTPMNPSVGLP